MMEAITCDRWLLDVLIHDLFELQQAIDHFVHIIGLEEVCTLK